MKLIFGMIVVFGSIFGGYVLAEGHLLALFQPFELLIIGGGAMAVGAKRRLGTAVDLC